MRLRSKKMRARVGPVRKFFLSENCSSTHFVPKSLWNFFWTIITGVMSIISQPTVRLCLPYGSLTSFPFLSSSSYSRTKYIKRTDDIQDTLNVKRKGSSIATQICWFVLSVLCISDAEYNTVTRKLLSQLLSMLFMFQINEFG